MNCNAEKNDDNRDENELPNKPARLNRQESELMPEEDYIGYIEVEKSIEFLLEVFVSMIFNVDGCFLCPFFPFTCTRKNVCIGKQIDSAHISFHLSTPSDACVMLLSYHSQFDYFTMMCLFSARAISISLSLSSV